MRILAPILSFLTLTSIAQTWQALPDFPGTARDDGSAFAIGTDVYMGTGREVTFGLTNDWYKFDALSSTWQQVASLPANGRQYCTAFTIDGIGYLFGGVDDSGLLADLWAYDPFSDAWTQRTPLPDAGRSGCVSFVIDGYVYIATGRYGANELVSADLWRYDPVNNSWLQRASLPSTPRLLAASFALDGKGFVVGGETWESQALSDAWSYDPGTNAWTAVTDFPDARYGADGFATNGKGLITCGESASNVYPDQAYQYDPVANEWTVTPHILNEPRKGGSGAVVQNVVFFGTGISVSTRLKDWQRLGDGVGVTEEASKGGIVLFPNPARDAINVSGVDARTVLSAQVRSTDGRMVRSIEPVEFERSINLNMVASGSYLLCIRTTTGTRSLRFVRIP